MHACVPALRSWEEEIDTYLFGRARETEEIAGIAEETLLVRTTDAEIAGVGQDGGLVSAMLIWALEHDVADAALVSYLEGDGSTWRAVPGVARTAADVLRAAGSRYTYSANPLAYVEATDTGADRIALVGMSCQASAPAVMAGAEGRQGRGGGSCFRSGCCARRPSTIRSSMSSSTCADGLKREDIVKMNIKGALLIWTRDGNEHRIPLKEAHSWTRVRMQAVSGLRGRARGHLRRRDRSRQRLDANDRSHRARCRAAGQMRDAGAVEVRPASDDGTVLPLLEKLSRVSRRHWPETADLAPGRIPVIAG